MKGKCFFLRCSIAVVSNNYPLGKNAGSWILNVFAPRGYQTQICNLPSHPNITYKRCHWPSFSWIPRCFEHNYISKNGIWDDNTFGLPEPCLPCCCRLGFRRWRIWRMLWNGQLRYVLLRSLETRQTSEYISSKWRTFFASGWLFAWIWLCHVAPVCKSFCWCGIGCRNRLEHVKL